MSKRRLVAAFLLAALAPVLGCGSKISEANYYRVQYGMTESEVEDLLGPAHDEQVRVAVATTTTAATTTTTRASADKIKSWTRDALTISVVFRDGVVVERSAIGIPAEGLALRAPQTSPATP